MKLTKHGRQFQHKGVNVLKIWPWKRYGPGKYLILSSGVICESKKELKRYLSTPDTSVKSTTGQYLMGLGVSNLSPNVDYNVVLVNYPKEELFKIFPSHVDGLGFAIADIYVVPCANRITAWAMLKRIEQNTVEDASKKYMIFDENGQCVTHEINRDSL